MAPLHGAFRSAGDTCCSSLDGRLNTLAWMVGANIGLTLLLIGKLLIAK